MPSHLITTLGRAFVEHDDCLVFREAFRHDNEHVARRIHTLVPLQPAQVYAKGAEVLVVSLDHCNVDAIKWLLQVFGAPLREHVVPHLDALLAKTAFMRGADKCLHWLEALKHVDMVYTLERRDMRIDEENSRTMIALAERASLGVMKWATDRWNLGLADVVRGDFLARCGYFNRSRMVVRFVGEHFLQTSSVESIAGRRTLCDALRKSGREAWISPAWAA